MDIIKNNLVDIVFVLLLIYFVYANKGFIDVFIDLIGFIFSLLFSYKLYGFIGKVLNVNLSLPIGFANASGFFIAWIVSEGVLFLLLSLVFDRIIKKISGNPLNTLFGYLAAIVQTFFVCLIAISFIFSFPVKGQIKEAILESRTGPIFVNTSQQIEKYIKAVFGDAVSETINFLTIKPESNETLDLGFSVDKSKLKQDSQSEELMFNLVNHERSQRGFKTLIFDNSLRDVARNYAQDMFENGFFSHTSAVDGTSPAERANRAGIEYFVIGENLAYAPDIYLAHQGLMNSEGHRRNILSEDYNKVGIGVIDAGVYGKIFVQEFTN